MKNQSKVRYRTFQLSRELRQGLEEGLGPDGRVRLGGRGRLGSAESGRHQHGRTTVEPLSKYSYGSKKEE